MLHLRATHHFVVAYYVPAGRGPLRMPFSLMLKRTGWRRIATEEWSLPYLNAMLVGGTAARMRSVCGSPYLFPIFASWRLGVRSSVHFGVFTRASAKVVIYNS